MQMNGEIRETESPAFATTCDLGQGRSSLIQLGTHKLEPSKTFVLPGTEEPPFSASLFEADQGR